MNPQVRKLNMLKGKKIILGITGSIAAYKSVLIIRELKKRGALVRVIQTESSLSFVTPLTLSTLSGNTVLSEMIDLEKNNWSNHVDLAKWGDLMIIAPVTAKTMSKMATGESDNLLMAIYLSVECAVYFAPAMDLDMYKHPSTKENICKLLSFGNKLIPSGFGELASGLVGEGRMAEPREIIEFILEDLKLNLPLYDKNILITSGPTFEPIDPVRFIGNYSTGKMGYHLALESAILGANVILIMGPSYLNVNNQSNIQQLNVKTTDEMYNMTEKHYKDSDIMIFAAAVSDYKPKTKQKHKIKKSNKKLEIHLERTKDILSIISSKRTSKQFIVGFALETENETENAKYKLINKDLDMVILNSLNDKGAGFGEDSNKITIIEKDNLLQKFELKNKSDVAKDILAKIIQRL